jgi:hypothetical protein
MNIRAAIYWAISLIIATVAAGQTMASAPEVQATVVPASLSISNMVAIPESARSVLLFIGILGVAFTYQRAWINFRGKPTA